MIAKSLFYFVLAGLCEIGGGYLICILGCQAKSIWLALFWALILYGVIPTLQTANFDESQHGGVFIVLSIVRVGWQGSSRQI